MEQPNAAYAGTASTAGASQGRVSGAVLRAIRADLGMTQPVLAEALGVGTETLRGWESGRRSLTAMQMHAYHRARRKLQLLRADLGKLDLLDQALTADSLLDDMSATADPQTHPLATQVADRTLTDLLAWPLTGKPPRALDGAGADRRLLLGAGERDSLAENLRAVAERARDPETGPLLRRQAYYLLAGHEPSRDWLNAMTRSEQRAAGDLRTWSPQWVAARSLAVSQSVLGDPEPLHRFIAEGLDHPENQLAHLRYWAYWVGEIPALWVADEQMMTPDQVKWGGEALARALIRNLDPAVPYRDLAAHALWSLFQHRRDLADNTELTSAFVDRMDVLADHADAVTADSRQRLDQVRYLVRR